MTVSTATAISLETPRNLSATGALVLDYVTQQSLGSVIGLSPNAIAVTDHSYAGGGSDRRKLWRTPTASPVPSSFPSPVPSSSSSSCTPSVLPTAVSSFNTSGPPSSSPSPFNTSLTPYAAPTVQPTATSSAAGTQQPTTTQLRHYVLQQLSLSVEFDVVAPDPHGNVSVNATVVAARAQMNRLIASVVANGALGAALAANLAASGNAELNNPVTLASAQHLASFFSPHFGAFTSQPTRHPTTTGIGGSGSGGTGGSSGTGGGGGSSGGGAVNHVKTGGQRKAAAASPLLIVTVLAATALVVAALK